MKKTIVLLLVLCISFSTPLLAFAGTDIKVFLNDTEVEFDQPPIIVEDRTLVPLRAICEAMHFEVFWYDEQQQIEIRSEQYYVTMQIDNNAISREDRLDRSSEIIYSDVAPQIINGRTLIPLRAVFEIFGVAVDWEMSDETLIITLIDMDIVTIYLNDEKLEFEKVPFEINGVVYAPISTFVEKANLVVYWNEETNVMSISNDNVLLWLQSGSREIALAKKNDMDNIEWKPLYGGIAVGLFLDEIFYIPVRSVFGALGANMRWDNTELKKELHIYYE